MNGALVAQLRGLTAIRNVSLKQFEVILWRKMKMLVRHLLEIRGYKVLQARDGSEALAICEEHRHIDLRRHRYADEIDPTTAGG